MSNIGPTDGKQFFRDLSRRLSRLENQLGQIGAKTKRQIATSQQVFVGPDDPSATLISGTEYIWYKTDGAGTLIDQIVGVA